jgi:hypothetical protein
MSHYTDQNRISDKAWMNSVLGQMGLQNQKSEEINEDDKTLDDFHNPGKMKYIAFVDHLKTMPTDAALILLKDFMIELLTHSRSTISPSKIINVVKFAIRKFEDNEVDLRNKTNKDAMEQ